MGTVMARKWTLKRHKWEYHKRIMALRVLFPGEEIAPVCDAYLDCTALDGYYGALCECDKEWK
jgi:hypothetical protein